MSLLQKFGPGTLLRWGDKLVAVVGTGAGGRIKLKHTERDSFFVVAHEDLTRRIAAGKARLECPATPNQNAFVRALAPAPVPVQTFDISALPLKEQFEVQRRLHYVRGTAAGGVTRFSHKSATFVIESLANDLEASWPDVSEEDREELLKAPSWRSVKRWTDAYAESGGDIKSLVHINVGNTTPRLEAVVRQYMEDAIRDHWLTPQRNSMMFGHERLLARIQQENSLRVGKKLAEPSFESFRRAIGRLDQFEVAEKRYGAAYARRLFHAYGAGVTADRPLQVVQMDHLKMDVVATRFNSTVVLGRPWLTCALDLNTRGILGYHLSIEPPSYASVMLCLQQAILPKPDYKTGKLPSHHAWEMYGIPDKLLLDNGSEFKGHNLRNAASHLRNMELEWCPPRKPWFKGAVERTFGTVNRDLINTLPGRVMPLKDEKGDYSPTECAVIDIDDLDCIVRRWITDVYHQTPHSAIDTTPAQKWRDGVVEFPPVLDVSAAELEVFLGQVETRKLHHYGIEFLGLYYNSEELACVRRYNDSSQPVTFKYNPMDLGAIHVLDPMTLEYFRAPCTLQKYAKGMSLYTHKLIRKRTRETCNEIVDWEGLLATKTEIIEFVNSLAADDISATRKHARVITLARQDAAAAVEGRSDIEELRPALDTDFDLAAISAEAQAWQATSLGAAQQGGV